MQLLLATKNGFVRAEEENGRFVPALRSLDGHYCTSIIAREGVILAHFAASPSFTSARATLRRARKALDKASSRGEADDFHDLRKAAKTHSMHLSLLGRLWPTPIKARRKAVDKLGEHLGELHDVFVMRALLDAEGDVVAMYSPTEHASLEGTAWQLTGYNAGDAIQSVIPDTKITATWGETSAGGAGEVTGSAGCNHYFGEYEVDGESLAVRAVGMTEMFCASPEGLMEQEQDYAEVLGRAASYRIQGDRLTVLGEGGERLLEFVAVTE